MVATTRVVFDHQLEALQHNVLRLAEMVEQELVQAVQALQCHDMGLARRIDTYDATVNQMRYAIEEQCYTLLALQQPNSRDMRYIVATVSIATNLERMGDHAAGIARLALRMNDASCRIQVPEFDEMATKLVVNLHDTIQAFVTQDEALAKTVANRDDEVDNLHDQVYYKLIQQMTEDSTIVECATMLLWVSHNLERYADRICNICERIGYLATGVLNKQKAAAV